MKAGLAEHITEQEALNEIERLRREREAAAVQENEACANTLEWIGSGAGEKAYLYESLARVLRARRQGPALKDSASAL